MKISVIHVSLTKKFAAEKKYLYFCGEQLNWNNIPSEVVKQPWQGLRYLLSLDVIFADMKPCFSKKIRSPCRFIPEIMIEHDENKINMFN